MSGMWTQVAGPLKKNGTCSLFFLIRRLLFLKIVSYYVQHVCKYSLERSRLCLYMLAV